VRWPKACSPEIRNSSQPWLRLPRGRFLKRHAIHPLPSISIHSYINPLQNGFSSYHGTTCGSPVNCQQSRAVPLIAGNVLEAAGAQNKTNRKIECSHEHALPSLGLFLLAKIKRTTMATDLGICGAAKGPSFTKPSIRSINVPSIRG
jgi:hypothetical protein